MLFNSLEYIFVFFPVTAAIYFFLNKRTCYRSATLWLVLASFCFYGYWNPKYILLIAGSIGVNFILGVWLQKKNRRSVLVLGLLFNLGLLGYFKYANFVVDNINTAFDFKIHLEKIELPLAISFFTFLQIAYLVDCFQNKVRETHFLHYTLFVTYFPHLIAGPLVHHRELMPEFSRVENREVIWRNCYLGLYIFSVGLFKKVCIADSFAEWANAGFDTDSTLTFYEAWGASLSYTMQLYFDFSGYSDMAIGASMMLNIKLPINFNSPYKAMDIQDFWHRWHMTLSRWLREYLYIPLGGNRRGSFFTGRNLFITFLLGGLWHGASWNFVIWGGLHGVAVVGHRLWRATGGNLPAVMAWPLTFLFVNVTWVFFRAESLDDSLRILSGMIDIGSAGFEPFWRDVSSGASLVLSFKTLIFLGVFIPICTLSPNSGEWANNTWLSKPGFLSCMWISFLMGCALYTMIFFSSRISEFIYFNF